MKTRLPLIVGLVTLVFSSVAGASDTRRLTWPVPVEEVPREQFIRELSSMTLHGRVGDDRSVPDHVTGRFVDDAWVFEVKGAHGAEKIVVPLPAEYAENQLWWNSGRVNLRWQFDSTARFPGGETAEAKLYFSGNGECIAAGTMRQWALFLATPDHEDLRLFGEVAQLTGEVNDDPR